MSMGPDCHEMFIIPSSGDYFFLSVLLQLFILFYPVILHEI